MNDLLEGHRIVELSVRLKRIDLLAVLFLFAQLAYSICLLSLTALDLAPDEAHYWEWSRNLDWAYYSKGPVVAYLIRASTEIFGDTQFAVRFPAIVCSLIFSALYYLYLRSLIPATLALLSLLALKTSLIFASQGLVMTTDSPLALFWLLAIVFAHKAVDGQDKAWLLFGLFVGLAVLSKYTALILYPSIFLLLLFECSLRKQLVNLWFWLGLGVFLVCLSPLLIWNLEYEWVNLFHNSRHLVKPEKFGFNPRYMFELIAGQIGLLGPIVALAFCYAVVWGLRERKLSENVLPSLWLFLSLPLLLVCLLVSLSKRVYANWPMPAYISLSLLFTFLICLGWSSLKEKRVMVFSSFALNLSALAFASILFLGHSFILPGSYLPTKKLVGWRSLGKHVGDLVSENQFIVTDSYGAASAIAFYAPGKPQVTVAPSKTRRMNQYDIWTQWTDLTGRDALLVLKRKQANRGFRGILF